MSDDGAGENSVEQVLIIFKLVSWVLAMRRLKEKPSTILGESVYSPSGPVCSFMLGSCKVPESLGPL